MGFFVWLRGRKLQTYLLTNLTCHIIDLLTSLRQGMDGQKGEKGDAWMQDNLVSIVLPLQSLPLPDKIPEWEGCHGLFTCAWQA